jgi:hypothetical protein
MESSKKRPLWVSFAMSCGFAFAASPLVANDAVTMSPGTSIVVQPSSSPTTVSCLADATVIEKFCVCQDPGPRFMKRLSRVYVLSNGVQREGYIGDYNDMARCESERQKSPACAGE